MSFELTVEACRERIRRENPAIHAVLTEIAPTEADCAREGPLARVPYVLKDTWDTKGIVTTGGSYRHRDRVPSESSRVHAAMEEAGAVLLGKSNLCDLSFSGESDNHLIGAVRNPLDPTRTAGGSTGGGAAAVASRMAAFDWGTDFGGSVRVPAAHCGVVGVRLSARTWPVEEQHFPRISPFFWSFCGMGPLTETVAESRRLVAALAPRLCLRPVDAPAIDRDRVFLWAPDRAHRAQWPSFAADAAVALQGLGVDVDLGDELPSTSTVSRLYNGYLCSHFLEFASSEELSFREGIPAVLLGLLSAGRLDKRVHPNTGALLLGAALGRFTVFRDAARWADDLEALRAAVARIFESGRLIVAPTCTVLPPKHGRAAFTPGLQAFAKLGNLVDATAAAVPFGTFDDGVLPRSIQVLGPAGSEDAVLALAERLERVG